MGHTFDNVITNNIIWAEFLRLPVYVKLIIANSVWVWVHITLSRNEKKKRSLFRKCTCLNCLPRFVTKPEMTHVTTEHALASTYKFLTIVRVQRARRTPIIFALRLTLRLLSNVAVEVYGNCLLQKCYILFRPAISHPLCITLSLDCRRIQCLNNQPTTLIRCYSLSISNFIIPTRPRDVFFSQLLNDAVSIETM